jgi:Putative Actinobacterial Holin-X, holin superfamily III
MLRRCVMQLRNEDRSLQDQTLGDLFGKLASDTSNLVRQEVTLAKVELTQSARETGRNLANLVIGGAIAYAALLTIVASAIMLLGQVMPGWSAALLVGLLIAGIAWLLVSKALAALRDTDMTPRNTVETLKEDAAWVKQQIK